MTRAHFSLTPFLFSTHTFGLFDSPWATAWSPTITGLSSGASLLHTLQLTLRFCAQMLKKMLFLPLEHFNIQYGAWCLRRTKYVRCEPSSCKSRASATKTYVCVYFCFKIGPKSMFHNQFHASQPIRAQRCKLFACA